jgi:hypothetical protein
MPITARFPCPWQSAMGNWVGCPNPPAGIDHALGTVHSQAQMT